MLNKITLGGGDLEKTYRWTNIHTHTPVTLLSNIHVLCFNVLKWIVRIPVWSKTCPRKGIGSQRQVTPLLAGRHPWCGGSETVQTHSSDDPFFNTYVLYFGAVTDQRPTAPTQGKPPKNFCDPKQTKQNQMKPNMTRIGQIIKEKAHAIVKI